MAQGLHLSQRMALTQVLAPQLQQSLALLQAPTLELKALVEQELQQNPVLEELPSLEPPSDDGLRQDGEAAPTTGDPAEPASDFDSPSERQNGEPADDFQAEFERLAQLDDDGYSSGPSTHRYSQEDEEKRQYMFESLVASTSLQENLLEQVRLSDLNEEQRAVADQIIGNIDDHGYLQASVDELAIATNVPAQTIAEVLTIIQTFHPPGVGARDVRECLMLQLERADRKLTLEYRIVDELMEALGKRRIPEIARSLGITIEEVQEAIERIGHLEPCPGRAFLPDNQQYILPEVFVQKNGDEFVVTTNNEQIPHLRISNTYKDLMSRAGTSTDVRDYIRDKIRAGKFLIKSLHQRQQTILNIAKEIVTRQREFMEHGVSQLKPLTMVQVASAVGVHETTVSRAVSGKYMQTPQGILEMKYFFTSGIKTSSGEGLSNTSVKDMIAEMIKKEDPFKPLSDEEIVRVLKEKGIEIARRTVAKYRSELKILPSHLRKQY
jgi:RNA polymerase sigma-54 factor